MGRFEESYLEPFPIAMVEKAGAPVALLVAVLVVAVEAVAEAPGSLHARTWQMPYR